MVTEFITLDGRISLKEDQLVFQKLKSTANADSSRFFHFVVLLFIIVAGVWRAVLPAKGMDIIAGIVYLTLGVVWIWPILRFYYRLLFLESWSSRINIRRINLVSVQAIGNGLETEVILQLQNGRKKFIVFRDAEKQLQPFIDAIKQDRQLVVNQ